MAIKVWPVKDPDERVRRGVNWAPDLEDDTITASEWFVEEGTVTIDDGDSFTDSTTTVWLLGGTLGETCIVTNRITTLAGEILDQSVKLKIKAK